MRRRIDVSEVWHGAESRSLLNRLDESYRLLTPTEGRSPGRMDHPFSSTHSPGGLGRLPGDHEAGVTLVQDVPGGQVRV
jgi:hypothetical protein